MRSLILINPRWLRAVEGFMLSYRNGWILGNRESGIGNRESGIGKCDRILDRIQQQQYFKNG
ncbi:hypothetical protein BJP37_25680 [Moorena bouillonii PNG]|uniref:Uncharacterized protein n=1 Tax=Moorena bouillonii PNG TaxID=568701 RepID=A0A1U7N7L6_9CYAN|nr:hypothetical protein BJP37_25680 [Moorena bouillonii PNG]